MNAVSVATHHSMNAGSEANFNVSTVNVAGIRVGRVDRSVWARVLARAARGRTGSDKPLFSTSLNSNTLSRIKSDKSFRSLVEAASFIDADGMPIVYFSRLVGNPIAQRCCTTDFVHDAAQVFEREGLSFYLLGGTEDANAGAAAELRRRYPNLRIVGRRNGYFGPAEEASVVDAINAAAPDLLWVSMGVPREHEFIVRNLDVLTNVGVAKTSGALFDYLAGNVSRAPLWMQRSSLEWLYRLWLEPRRLARRYLFTNSHSASVLMVALVMHLFTCARRFEREL